MIAWPACCSALEKRAPVPISQAEGDALRFWRWLCTAQLLFALLSLAGPTPAAPSKRPAKLAARPRHPARARAGEPDVDRPAAQMQATAGHAAAALAQGLVGGGRSVARDDVEGSLAARLCRQPVQQVEQHWGDAADIADAEIAQQVVHDDGGAVE